MVKYYRDSRGPGRQACGMWLRKAMAFYVYTTRYIVYIYIYIYLCGKIVTRFPLSEPRTTVVQLTGTVYNTTVYLISIYFSNYYLLLFILFTLVLLFILFIIIYYYYCIVIITTVV
jgi:hypothetical protein